MAKEAVQAMLGLPDTGGMTLEQVREQLGVGSYSAVAMQIGRLQRQLPQNPQLRKQLRAIARRLNVQC